MARGHTMVNNFQKCYFWVFPCLYLHADLHIKIWSLIFFLLNLVYLEWPAWSVHSWNGMWVLPMLDHRKPHFFYLGLLKILCSRHSLLEYSVKCFENPSHIECPQLIALTELPAHSQHLLPSIYVNHPGHSA